VFVHANTKLIDKETSAGWELEQDSEYGATETDDADSTSETEFYFVSRFFVM